jgi:hypothetical protein
MLKFGRVALLGRVFAHDDGRLSVLQSTNCVRARDRFFYGLIPQPNHDQLMADL